MWRTIGRVGVQQTRSPSTEFRGPNILSGLWRSTYTGYYDNDPTWFSDDANDIIESIPVDNFDLYDGDIFSSQWLGYFRAPHTANYTFYLHSDDASKFWIGNNAITGYTDANTTVKIDAYSDPEADSDAISLTAGQYYPIRLQYGNNGGFASLTLSWSDDYTPLPDTLFELDASTYTSGTTWADSSTHGRNATLHGGVTWSSEAGGCFVFTGDDTKFIDITGSESGFGIRDLAPNATFSIWVNLDSEGGFIQQVGGWRGNHFNFYFVVIQGGTEARVDSGTPQDIGVSYGSYFNNWTLVTFATNSTTSSLYLNGALVGTNTNISGTQWSGDAIFELGHSRDYQFPITGKIGGAIAYDRELTQLEVTTEFNRTKTRYGL